MLSFVIMVAFWTMIIIARPRTQRFQWYTQCRGNRVEHVGRWGAEPMLDLGEIWVGDTSHRRNLAHGQLGQLTLPADDLAKS